MLQSSHAKYFISYLGVRKLICVTSSFSGVKNFALSPLGANLIQIRSSTSYCRVAQGHRIIYTQCSLSLISYVLCLSPALICILHLRPTCVSQCHTIALHRTALSHSLHLASPLISLYCHVTQFLPRLHFWRVHQ